MMVEFQSPRMIFWSEVDLWLLQLETVVSTRDERIVRNTHVQYAIVSSLPTDEAALLSRSEDRRQDR